MSRRKHLALPARFHAALLFVALVCAFAVAAAAECAQPTATDIYDRVRAVVAARTVPPYIAYTQTAEFARRGHSRSQTDRIVLRLADGIANITPLDHGPVQSHISDRPLVSPTTTFGLWAPSSSAKPSTFESDVESQPAGPSQIGHVTSTAHAYDATLAGVETVDGARVYHLLMVPRFDARRNRIRALFVDTATYQPRRIVIEYFAARGPVTSRPTVSFDYTPIDGNWVINHASMNFVVRFGPFAYGGAGELHIRDVSFPATEPAGLFDSPSARNAPPR